MQINWNQSAKRLFNFIRALDSVPGAVAYFMEEEEIEIRLFGASILEFAPKGEGVTIKGLNQQAIVHENGIAIRGTDGRYVRDFTNFIITIIKDLSKYTTEPIFRSM